MLPEFDNKLIVLGNQVVMGLLSQTQAILTVRADPELSALTNDVLKARIEETGRYWREHLNAAVGHPENVVIYPALMVECAEVRLQAIGRLRAGTDEQAKLALDREMAAWITLTAQCLTDQGMVLLLVPDLQRAWESFSKANLMARALPDFGQLRVREVLWAAYGQRLATYLGGQDELYRSAAREFDDVVQFPEHQSQAQAYVAEIRQEFERLEQVAHRRQAFLRGELSEDDVPPESKVGYAVAYMSLLNQLAHLVLQGQVEAAEARQRILEEIDLSHLEPVFVYYAAMFHDQLVVVDPDRAVVVADLNYATAGAFAGGSAGITRGYCAMVLGAAWLNHARGHGDVAEEFRRAIPYLEEALARFVPEEGYAEQLNAVGVLSKLAMCYRGIGEFEKAAELNRQAIERGEALPADPVNLGVAYGNLADTQEQIGDANAAFDNHYRAFQLFTRAQNVQYARQALHYLTRLAAQVGRLDDAAAALGQTAELLSQVADIGGAVEAHLLLAQYAMRNGHHDEALSALQQAQELLLPTLSEPQPEQRYLELYIDLMIGNAFIVSPLLLAQDDAAYHLDELYKRLENARALAVNLQDEYRLGQVLIQLAILFRTAGQLDQATMYCRMVESVPQVTLNQQARADEILGSIYVLKGQYDDALVLLRRALETYDSTQADRRMNTLNEIAQAYEGLNDREQAVHAYEQAIGLFETSRLGLYEVSRLEFMHNAMEIYNRLISLYAGPPLSDSIRALGWLERSKSRTFVETLGLSTIPPPELPDAARQMVREEQGLIDRVNRIRGELFFQPGPGANRLALQQELHTTLQRLDQVWNQLQTCCAEYVELRRGDVADWLEVQELLIS